jgi:hypothetical protein
MFFSFRLKMYFGLHIEYEMKFFRGLFEKKRGTLHGFLLSGF